MLSIRFSGEREWWVSSRVFEDLFHAARQAGAMPDELEDYQHVVVANGGFNVPDFPGETGVIFERALIRAARSELERLHNEKSEHLDLKYGQSLQIFLRLFTNLN